MKATALEGISRELGSVSTRRGFMKLLGGMTAVAAVSAVGIAEPAIARRKKKSKKGQSAVCRPGKQIARLSVPGNGQTVLTPLLLKGQVYEFEASGSYATNAVHQHDAEYDFIPATAGDASKAVDAFGGVDTGLSIDDATVDATKSPRWGAYNPNHVYTIQVVGRGRPATLQNHDSVFTDNSGALTVTIRCGQ